MFTVTVIVTLRNRAQPSKPKPQFTHPLFKLFWKQIHNSIVIVTVHVTLRHHAQPSKPPNPNPIVIPNSLNYLNIIQTQFHFNFDCNLTQPRTAIQAPTTFYSPTRQMILNITPQIVLCNWILRRRAQPSKPQRNVTHQLCKCFWKLLPNYIQM